MANVSLAPSRTAAGEIEYWDPEHVVESAEPGEIDVFTQLNGTGPTFSENPWDIVFISGDPLPGICRVKGAPTLAVDKKKSGGGDGAVITINGYLPGPIEISCTMWTQEQWSFFQQAASKLWTKPTKKTAAAKLAVAVSHPALDLWGVNAIVIVGVGVPEPGSVPQSMVVKIKAVEYVPITGKKSRTVRNIAPVKEDSRTSGALNGLGEDPSETDAGPEGHTPDTHGGAE